MIRLALLLAIAAPAAPQVAAPALGFEEALRIGNDAVRRARANGKPISIVVVNREGRVLAAMRMDGTSYVNLEVAEAKAVTAATLGIPSGALGEAIDGGKPSLLAVSNLNPIAGGMPVMRAGTVIGGVGVSGGTPEDDLSAATAAIAERR